MSRNTLLYGTIGRSVADAVRRRLPATWSVELLKSPDGRGEGSLRLACPDGMQAQLVIHERHGIEPRDVRLLVETNGTHAPRLVVAPFLSPRTRELLAAAGLSYADATGNLRVALTSPALFIEVEGKRKNPEPERRPLHSLKGPAAARIVRALVDFRPPVGIRELSVRAKAAPATAVRVAALLDREALVTRDTPGTIADVSWPALLRRWVEDLVDPWSERRRVFLEPRGLPALDEKLKAYTAEKKEAVAGRYAVTATAASDRGGGSVVPRRHVAIYAEDLHELARALDLRPVEAGSNVLLLDPFDPVVFERTSVVEGVIYVALSQTVVDLLMSPGRGPEEGERLLARMQEDEAAWRT